MVWFLNFVQLFSNFIKICLFSRSGEYLAINDEALASIRRIFEVPNNYKVLLMAGGGTGQFSAVPLNLLKEGQSADYCVTGFWSERALTEAKKFGSAKNVINLSKFNTIPEEPSWNRSEDASYFYYCDNETIHGVEFPFIPGGDDKCASVPLVADMSSNLGSRAFDVNKFGVCYAAVHKNLGPAGCTVVIAREDLLGSASTHCPTILDYEQIARGNSVINTPTTFSIYVTKLVLDWLEDNGGLPQMEQNSQVKAKLLYDVIDNSNDFYTCEVLPQFRSRCNVVFRIKGGDELLEKGFVEAAKLNNLLALEGHFTVGGLRASLYNAVSVSVVEKLAHFMQDFQAAQS